MIVFFYRVEQELMARIITEMSRGQATLTERQHAQRNIPETAESETSSLDESVASAPGKQPIGLHDLLI